MIVVDVLQLCLSQTLSLLIIIQRTYARSIQRNILHPPRSRRTKSVTRPDDSLPPPPTNIACRIVVAAAREARVFIQHCRKVRASISHLLYPYLPYQFLGNRRLEKAGVGHTHSSRSRSSSLLCSLGLAQQPASSSTSPGRRTRRVCTRPIQSIHPSHPSTTTITCTLPNCSRHHLLLLSSRRSTDSSF